MSSRRVSAGSGTNGHAAVVALRGGSLMSGVGSIGIVYTLLLDGSVDGMDGWEVLCPIARALNCPCASTVMAPLPRKGQCS